MGRGSLAELLQKAAFCVVKGYLLRCDWPPFAARKAVFYKTPVPRRNSRGASGAVNVVMAVAANRAGLRPFRLPFAAAGVVRHGAAAQEI